MRTITSVAGIKDPYTKRILSHVVGKDAFAVYCRTPSRLQRLAAGLSTAQLSRLPARGKWSIGQIITHLCDGEIVMGFRLRMAVAESGAALQAFDQDKWAAHLGYRTADAREKLRLFVALRRDHIRLLRRLPAGAWKRYGMHKERGKETVERMIQLEAGHDINHLRQVAAIKTSMPKRKR